MDKLFIQDITWNSAENVIKLEKKRDYLDSIIINSLHVEFSEKSSKPSKTFISTENYKRLIDLKNKIPQCVHWDKWNKLTNPYDRIQIVSGTKHEKEYFKYLEIFKYFNIKIPDGSNTIHIGKSANSIIKLLKEQDTLSIYSIGVQNSDAINIENIDYMNDKVYLFSGDIDGDVSHDPNNKEQILFNTFFIQVLSCFNVQEVGGVSIIKIFDTITRPTCQLIQYITNFYDNVYIIKPRTSSCSSSEKYIVAINFSGVTINELIELELIKENWKDSYYCRNLGVEQKDDIDEMFYNYNKTLVNNQHDYIERIIKYSYEQDEGNINLLEGNITAFQNKKAQEFCNYIYGIKCEIEECKHIKKSKINNFIKNCNYCNKCFQLFIYKL